VTELNQLLKRLCEADIQFVVVGGFAATLHGSSLLTRVLDVCTILTAEHVAKLRETFRDLHPIHRFTPQRLSFLDNPDPGTPLNNLYFQTDFGPIDFLGYIKGVGNYEEVLENSIEVNLFGYNVRVINRTALIKAKEALGRDKDKLTVTELRAIIEKSSGP
jgi:hypothetical protein